MNTPVGLRDAFAAEWIKLLSVRSPRVTLPLTVVAAAGLALLVGLSFRHADPATSHFDAPFATYYGLTLAQLSLVVFAVVAVGGEYSGGTIRPTLLAVPRRGIFYLAQIGTIGSTSAIVSLAAVAVSYVVARAVLGPLRPGMLAATVGAFCYLVLITLFVVGVATMVRSSVIALGVLLPILFLGSQGVGNIPVVRDGAQFLPDEAGTIILHLYGVPGQPDYHRALGPWSGLAVLALWAAAALLGGYLVLRDRDA